MPTRVYISLQDIVSFDSSLKQNLIDALGYTGQLSQKQLKRLSFIVRALNESLMEPDSAATELSVLLNKKISKHELLEAWNTDCNVSEASAILLREIQSLQENYDIVFVLMANTNASSFEYIQTKLRQFDINLDVFKRRILAFRLQSEQGSLYEQALQTPREGGIKIQEKRCALVRPPVKPINTKGLFHKLLSGKSEEQKTYEKQREHFDDLNAYMKKKGIIAMDWPGIAKAQSVKSLLQSYDMLDELTPRPSLLQEFSRFKLPSRRFSQRQVEPKLESSEKEKTVTFSDTTPQPN